MIRLDYLISSWIFIWYVLYQLDLTTYNPKFAFYIGVLENIGVLFSMIYHQVSWKIILLFGLVVLLFKVIPLWTLRNTTLYAKDLYATFMITLFYMGWIYWSEKVKFIREVYLGIWNHPNQLFKYSKIEELSM